MIRSVVRFGTAAMEQVGSGVRAASRAPFVPARVRGFVYRATGGQTDPDVSDDILADRVRTALGSLQKELGVERVNVTVEKGTVILHGVATTEQAARLERAAVEVSGVRSVDSHLRE